MHPATHILIFLTCGLLQAPLYAQVLKNPTPEEANSPQTEAPPATTLIFRDAPPESQANGVSLQNEAELNAVIKHMRDLLRELAQADMSPAQKQAALDELIRDNHSILRQHRTFLDWQKPQTVDSVSLLLERMVFEIAADIAPTEQSREQVLQNAPQHLELDPNQPQAVESYAPPLLAPVAGGKEKGNGDQPQPELHGTEPDIAPAETAVSVARPAPQAVPDKKDDDEGPVKVAILADKAATTEMHDDKTVLRSVEGKDGELVLFGDMHLWAGGAIQYDGYAGEGLFTLAQDGDSDSELYVRRAEGVFRASLFEHNEIKVQYDFDANIFRNLYWRWLSKSTSQSVTVGNQKEPMGQDYLVGNKFGTAMEASAPASAFGSYRSTGIRYNSWSALESKDNPFPIKKLWGDSRTYLTSSIGLFGQDIENSNDTDWAVTGRITMGGNKTETSGFQLGVSGSYRHGEFDRIAPRPGIHDANRIPLGQPEADTQALMALEGLYTRGSLHSQAELYVSDYSGGEVDAQGWGAYGQVGWLFGGKRRSYRPRWGQWAQIDANDEHVFEVFGRFSFTHGNDDVHSSNDLSLLTLGGNWYYGRFRVSANLILADTARDVFDESSGHSLAARLQYLF